MCIENKFMGIFGILFFIIGLLLLPIPTSLGYISSLGSFSFLGAPLSAIMGAFLGYKLSNKRWETQRKIQQKKYCYWFL